MLALENTVYN